MRLRQLSATIVAGVAIAAAASVSAQERPDNFPRRPIELVVVYPAGGGMDVTARILAEHGERMLGHQFRVANRTGGGGRVGHTYLAREARADGYTVGVLSMGALFNHIIEDDSQFNADDFDPIVHINFEPYIYMTRGEPMGDLVERAKAEGPGRVRIGVVSGSTSDLAMYIVEQEAGIEFAQVPFQGGAPRLVGLVNGTIDVAPMFYSEAEQYHRSGDATFVAVTGHDRHPDLPDVPTLPEIGIDVPPNTLGATRFIQLPVGVPEDVRNYIAEAFIRVLEDPETVEAYRRVGVSVQVNGPERTREIYDTVLEATRELNALLGDG